MSTTLRWHRSVRILVGTVFGSGSPGFDRLHRRYDADVWSASTTGVRVSLRAQPWPIPRPSWRARRYCSTTLTDKTVPFDGDVIDFASSHSDAPSVRRRVRRLESGGSVTVNLLIVGRLSWCPPFPSGHPVVLTATSAVSSGGGGASTERRLPLESLRATDARLLDPPGRPVVPGLEMWSLTVSQADDRRVEQGQGTATITGLLADLAVLAAVAGWPPPPALREHPHAGAVGARPVAQPARPPIRPVGWALVALGILMIVGSIATLALSSHGGPMAPLGATAGLLMVSGLGLRQRRPHDRKPSSDAPSTAAVRPGDEHPREVDRPQRWAD